jgi:hypothetical protein
MSLWRRTKVCGCGCGCGGSSGSRCSSSAVALPAVAGVDPFWSPRSTPQLAPRPSTSATASLFVGAARVAATGFQGTPRSYWFGPRTVTLHNPREVVDVPPDQTAGLLAPRPFLDVE